MTGCTAPVQGDDDQGPDQARADEPAAVAEESPLRAFTDDSWWNTPVPEDAPEHPRAEEILHYMSTAKEAGGGCVRLSGAEDNNWGQPVWWAESGDPTYDVELHRGDPQPELQSLRIPHDAEAADNSDGSMTVFDVERGYAVAFTDARYDADTDRWSAGHATVTYLASNGLDVRTGEATDERNRSGHRGNNPAVMMVRFDEVEAGSIPHVLKVASGPEASRRHVFPMVGSDGDSGRREAPPQGLRFRIRPSVDLGDLDLPRQTRVIAEALQDYGFYIGDSGGVTALKLEDTRAAGKGQLWDIPATALCDLPLDPTYWQVLPEGYRPPPA